MNQVVQTLEQQMYLTKLIGYDYSIQYRFDKTNMVTDALSWIPKTPSSSLLLLSVPCLTFLEELKQHLSRDQAFIQLWQAISDKLSGYPNYSIAQDLILKRRCIWLPQALPFILTVTSWKFLPGIFENNVFWMIIYISIIQCICIYVLGKSRNSGGKIRGLG